MNEWFLAGAITCAYVAAICSMCRLYKEDSWLPNGWIKTTLQVLAGMLCYMIWIFAPGMVSMVGVASHNDFLMWAGLAPYAIIAIFCAHYNIRI